MNRLLGHIAYLAGPIDRCPDDGAPWRDWMTPRLHGRGIGVIDPLQKPVDVGLEDDDGRQDRRALKEAGDYDGLTALMKPVRNVDLRFVDKADFTVACIDMDVQMCGTWEEVFTGNREKKPILVWCPQGKRKVPDWLFSVMPHQMMFGGLEALLDYLDHVASDPRAETYNRWVFFDFGRIYSPATLAAMAETYGGVPAS